MIRKRIVARPVWYVTTAPVRGIKTAHITYDTSDGAVCGDSLDGSAVALDSATVSAGAISKRCAACLEWLRLREPYVPAVAVTFFDVEAQ